MENKGPLIVVLDGWWCGGGLCDGSSDGGGCAMVARVDGDQVEEREGESRDCGDGNRGGWQWEGGYGGESEVAVEVVDERGTIEEESVVKVRVRARFRIMFRKHNFDIYK